MRDRCRRRAVLVAVDVIFAVRVRPVVDVARRAGTATADQNRDGRERRSQQAQDDSTSVLAHGFLQGSGGFRGLAKPGYCIIA